jgi:hypothetical protein
MAVNTSWLERIGEGVVIVLGLLLFLLTVKAEKKEKEGLR